MADNLTPAIAEVPAVVVTEPVVAATETPVVTQADGTAAAATTETFVDTKAESRIRKMQIQAQRAREEANAALAEAKKVQESTKQADAIKQILLTSKSPKKDLASIGVDFNDLITRYTYEEIGGEPAGPTAEDRIKILEDERATQRETQMQAAIAAQRKEVATLFSSSEIVPKADASDPDESYADRFELVNAYDRTGDVFEATAHYCSKNPNITPEQVDAALIYFATQIESSLESDVLEKAAGTKKLAKRFQPKGDVPRENQNPDPSKGTTAPSATQLSGNKKPNTLHPGLGRATPTGPTKGPMNERQRIKWALAQVRENGTN
jgi:hypothetical protein